MIEVTRLYTKTTHRFKIDPKLELSDGRGNRYLASELDILHYPFTTSTYQTDVVTFIGIPLRKDGTEYATRRKSERFKATGELADRIITEARRQLADTDDDHDRG